MKNFNQDQTRDTILRVLPHLAEISFPDNEGMIIGWITSPDPQKDEEHKRIYQRLIKREVITKFGFDCLIFNEAENGPGIFNTFEDIEPYLHAKDYTDLIPEENP